MATRDLVSLVFTANDKQVQQALTRTGKGLDGLGGQAEKSGGRIQKSFSGAGTSVKGLAGRIPGIGGALSALTSPAGIATAAIGLVVAGIGAAVGKVASLEKELRPMIQQSGLSAESLQVLGEAAQRLGSKDGLDGVTDSAQELQLRLAEASQDATGPAVAAFEKLGLASADLIAASPEDSFLAVITALQGVTNESDRKFLADELLGGSSENLSGVLNANAAEFRGLTDSIRENGDIISNEGIANANAFNLALGKLGDGFGGIATQVGTAFIPLLTEIIEGITELWTEIEGPVLWVLGILTEVLGGALRNAFKIIAGAINIVAGILTGDFSQAWRGIQQVAQGVMNQIILIYNNTIARLPGVSKIDMLTFADNIEIAEDAVDDLSDASDDLATAQRLAGEAAAKQAEEEAKLAAELAKTKLATDDARRSAEALVAARTLSAARAIELSRATNDEERAAVLLHFATEDLTIARREQTLAEAELERVLADTTSTADELTAATKRLEAADTAVSTTTRDFNDALAAQNAVMDTAWDGLRQQASATRELREQSEEFARVEAEELAASLEKVADDLAAAAKEADGVKASLDAIPSEVTTRIRTIRSGSGSAGAGGGGGGSIGATGSARDRINALFDHDAIDAATRWRWLIQTFNRAGYGCAYARGAGAGQRIGRHHIVD